MLNPLSPVLENRLLASLPPDVLQRWIPDLEPVDMALGEVIYETGAEPEYAYFPISTVVSILYVMKNGESAEIAVVGNEGIVGISLFMGGGATSSRAVVQNAGRGFRLNTASLLREFNRGGIVMQHLLRVGRDSCKTQQKQA